MYGEFGTWVGGESHPTGVRGLKCHGDRVEKNTDIVAPHWGAWIEICRRMMNRLTHGVAPHWGAWIEIV